MNAKHAHSLDTMCKNRNQIATNDSLMGFVVSLRLCLWVQIRVLLFCDANNEHDFVVGANNIPVHAPGFRVNRPTSVVVFLRRLGLCTSFLVPFNDLIVRRAPLSKISTLEGAQMEAGHAHQCLSSERL